MEDFIQFQKFWADLSFSYPDGSVESLDFFKKSRADTVFILNQPFSSKVVLECFKLTADQVLNCKSDFVCKKRFLSQTFFAKFVSECFKLRADTVLILNQALYGKGISKRFKHLRKQPSLTNNDFHFFITSFLQSGWPWEP
jgi:hypothetical protein